MRAIITHSWFETTLDYKPRILGPTFLVYVLKWSAILTALDYKNGLKNIKTTGYNGVRTVSTFQNLWHSHNIWTLLSSCLHGKLLKLISKLKHLHFSNPNALPKSISHNVLTHLKATWLLTNIRKSTRKIGVLTQRTKQLLNTLSCMVLNQNQSC